MKKYFNLIAGLAILPFLAVAGQAGKGLVVSGKFRNSGTAKYVYLFEQVGTELKKIDSVHLKNEAFSFSFKTSPARGFYRLGPNEETSFQFILANENIVAEADASDPGNVKITGSKENQAFEEFRKFNEQHQGYYQQLNADAQAAEQTYGAGTEGYNNKIRALQKRLDSLNNVRISKYSLLQKNNKGLFIEKYIKAISVDTLPKEQFFTDADFKDTELARTDVLPTKVSIYMQKFVPQDLESWKSESDGILARASALNLNKEVLYITVIRNMANNDMDYTRAVAKKYLAEFPASTFARRFWSLLPKAAPAIGEAAPDIKLPSPSGDPIALSSLKGKVVLLDFWASWCGPCRRENPNVVRAYEKYKDKGFTVYSVSLDTEKDRWTKAIQADGLVWQNHVSDLQGWQSSAAKLYGVRGIPNTFLLDKNGNVVAVNLRGESLEEKLAELLK
jgi:thiol-disulfide isomerase/thioredoxin